MKIKKIIRQNRRDFTAIYECEHCGNIKNSTGYDDDYFHKKVIPEMVCEKCDKKSPKDYQPRDTKYQAWEVI